MAAETPFVSAPDPANGGVRYRGGITFSMNQGGYISRYGLFISNTGDQPFHVAPSDFVGISQADPRNRHVPITWGAASNAAPLRPQILPGKRERGAFVAAEQISGIIWTIQGSLGTVAVPFTAPVASASVPTPQPHDCRAP
jgi:hypothetical protein